MCVHNSAIICNKQFCEKKRLNKVINFKAHQSRQKTQNLPEALTQKLSTRFQNGLKI